MVDMTTPVVDSSCDYSLYPSTSEVTGAGAGAGGGGGHWQHQVQLASHTARNRRAILAEKITELEAVSISMVRVVLAM